MKRFGETSCYIDGPITVGSGWGRDVVGIWLITNDHNVISVDKQEVQ